MTLFAVLTPYILKPQGFNHRICQNHSCGIAWQEVHNRLVVSRQLIFETMHALFSMLSKAAVFLASMKAALMYVQIVAGCT